VRFCSRRDAKAQRTQRKKDYFWSIFDAEKL